MTADQTARPIPTYTDQLEAAKLEAENDRLRAELATMTEVAEGNQRNVARLIAELERVTADRDRLAAACALIDRELTPHAHRAGMSPGHEAIAQALAATGWPGYRPEAADPFEHPTGAPCSDPWCEDKAADAPATPDAAPPVGDAPAGAQAALQAAASAIRAIASDPARAYAWLNSHGLGVAGPGAVLHAIAYDMETGALTGEGSADGR